MKSVLIWCVSFNHSKLGSLNIKVADVCVLDTDAFGKPSYIIASCEQIDRVMKLDAFERHSCLVSKRNHDQVVDVWLIDQFIGDELEHEVGTLDWLVREYDQVDASNECQIQGVWYYLFPICCSDSDDQAFDIGEYMLQIVQVVQ